MTDFADGVEQNRVVILGDGSHVEKDEPFLDPSYHRRVPLAQGPGQLGFRISTHRKRGRNGDRYARYGLNRRAPAAQI